VISQEIFDPTPSTYLVDWCETWGFRWKTKLRRVDYFSMKKGKASKQMCHYICSPRFLSLALKQLECGKGVGPIIKVNSMKACSRIERVTREVKLTLLYLHHGLLVTIDLSYPEARSLLLGLDPLMVWALVGIMPGLSTIVANTGLEFLWLEVLWLSLAVLKISRRLILARSHSPMA
jgi:hypothetical protein